MLGAQREQKQRGGIIGLQAIRLDERAAGIRIQAEFEIRVAECLSRASIPWVQCRGTPQRACASA